MIYNINMATKILNKKSQIAICCANISNMISSYQTGQGVFSKQRFEVNEIIKRAIGIPWKLFINIIFYIIKFFMKFYGALFEL